VPTSAKFRRVDSPEFSDAVIRNPNCAKSEPDCVGSIAADELMRDPICLRIDSRHWFPINAEPYGPAAHRDVPCARRSASFNSRDFSIRRRIDSRD
jgi:hypothetical protein